MSVNHLGDRVRSDCSWPCVISCACILLVDNNPASLVHTASLLQEKLYNVTTAGSAAMALKFFEARKGFYDIVMADFNMQDMNIFEFVQRILHQSLTFIPIILMAEDYNMHMGEEALKKGASLFIEKPLLASDIARLWHQILWMTGRIPGATSTKQKKRTLINSDEVNGKRRKSQNAQGRVTSTESGQKKASNMRNVYGYYQAPSHLQVHGEGKILPSNPLATPPIRNVVDFTFEGLQQNLNKFHSINALNGTIANGIMMNTGSGQAVGENGGVQVLMGGAQVTTTNGHMTGAFLVPNQEISGNLGRGIYSNENDAINTQNRQLAQEIAGAEIFREGGEVTQTTGFVTGALHVPNQEASGYLARGVYRNENFMRNTESSQVGGETGGGLMFMEGVTPTNGFLSHALQVPSQEAVLDFGRGIYCNRNGIIMSTESRQVAQRNGGVQIFMRGGQVTDALHVPNQQPSGDLANVVSHNGNVISNTGIGQVGGEIGGRQIFMEGDQVTPINGCVTAALQVLNQEPSSDLDRVVYGHENVMSHNGRGHVGWENGEGQIIMEGTPTNGVVTSAFHLPNQEASGDLGGGIYSSKNVLRNTGSGQVAKELAGAQIFMEGDNQNTGQGTATGPNDIAEKQLTDEDIDEFLRELYEETTYLAVEASSTN